MPFRPGLVGGNRIVVDPYYLTHKAHALSYHPKTILAGRHLNDSMGAYVVAQLVKTMTKRRIQVEGAKIMAVGFIFKENCPDLLNTRVVDIVTELGDYDCVVSVYDPWAAIEKAQRVYDIIYPNWPDPGRYDAIILAVAHRQFSDMVAVAIHAFWKPVHVLHD